MKEEGEEKGRRRVRGRGIEGQWRGRRRLKGRGS